jgi:hypothetical protein
MKVTLPDYAIDALKVGHSIILAPMGDEWPTDDNEPQLAIRIVIPGRASSGCDHRFEALLPNIPQPCVVRPKGSPKGSICGVPGIVRLCYDYYRMGERRSGGSARCAKHALESANRYNLRTRGWIE